jgi:GH15 family glucan-1,4-alpha-glucosidase
VSYKPIEDYGIVGDLHTVALVGTDGSIDWSCLPHFDSPSVFAALLDDKKGGCFKVSGVGEGMTRQMYHPETNVLMTYFSSKDGVALLEDFMPLGGVPGGGRRRHNPVIIRRVTGVRGTRRMRLECSPAFDYARRSHKVVPTERGVVFEAEAGERLGLSLPARTDIQVYKGTVISEFNLSAGDSFTVALALLDEGDVEPMAVSEEDAQRLLDETLAYWRRWLSRCTYRGRWREMVYRSVLTLKLLTFAPTGAIVAAPTCSLPEVIGGSRNWDYRYTWLRDAAFTLYAFMRVGLTEEAGQFMQWLEARTSELGADGTPEIMYRLDGGHTIEEETLNHLDGYRGSRPVRVGNNAHHQLQLDIFGELMDSVYLYDKYGSPISYDLWRQLRRLIDWVANNWRQPDEGIWEVRGGRHQFVYSKLMCWVALDRSLRLADKRSFPADRELWLRERDAIYETIMERGWSPRRKAFVQYFDSEVLDAANLMMPLVFFISPTDPRMLSTIDAVLKDLTSDSLVHRYDVGKAAADGLGQVEGSFSMCTFWLVEALTRSGRLNESRFIFERMLGYSNHVGLYAEEIGPSGEALGNFPQAFTHLGLISAAFNLDKALGGGV